MCIGLGIWGTYTLVIGRFAIRGLVVADTTARFIGALMLLGSIFTLAGLLKKEPPESKPH